MSLYTDAEKAISNPEKAGGSLKSRVYNGKTWQNPPAKIYALVSETTKWSPVLKEVIEKGELLKFEKKLNPVLANLLVHDFLLAKRGIGTSMNHPLHSAILRHKARLNAEFTKARLRRGFSTLEEFRENINERAEENMQENLESDGLTDSRHPRWLRINTLRTSLEEQLKSTFASFTELNSLSEVLKAKRGENVFTKDQNIDGLLALPPGYDLSKMDSYKRGEVVIQDKASCIPAFLLDPASTTGDIIDACAAPGNKTTHLAALLHLTDKSGRKVIAFEKDKNRSQILRKMVTQAGADRLVQVNGSTDFLATKPGDFPNVTAILLDPSCSGSGIVGRDDGPKMELPSSPFMVGPGQSQITNPGLSSSAPTPRKLGNPRKRKRNNHVDMGSPKDHIQQANAIEKELEISNEEEENEFELKRRLDSLSGFQLKLLLHAMSFPAVERIVYSTCSIHKEENEFVVLKALMSEKSQGWELLLRNQQVEGLANWDVRGDTGACLEASSHLQQKDSKKKTWVGDGGGFEKARANNGGQTDLDLFDWPWSSPRQIAEACIRCPKGEGAGTIGFFVAGLVRTACMKDGTSTALPVGPSRQVESENENSSEKEWAGFSDEDNDG